jgi:iron complex transport system substrate-binding protein
MQHLKLMTEQCSAFTRRLPIQINTTEAFPMKARFTNPMSLTALLIFFLTGVLFWPNLATAASTVTMTDFQGRSVTIKTPVKRFVLFESSKLPEIAAIAGEDCMEQVVGWDNDFRQNAGDWYAKYIEKFPSLAKVPDVGSMYEGTMSVEKVIDLKPDLVIAHKWMYMFGEEATRAALTRLDQAGIPVIFLDFYVAPLKNSTKSMQMLGRIFKQEDRAAKVVDFYNQHLSQVAEKLKDAKQDNLSVYVECTYKGSAEYGLSYGDVAWGLLVKAAGGNNIGTALLGEKAKALSPEYVLEKSPQAIILTGRNWKNPTTVKMGYLATADQVKSTMKPFMDRPGWDDLEALRGKKVYGLYHGYCFSIFNFVAVQAMAKWFHPQAFSEIDAEATLKEFHDRFLPVPYDGTFLLSYF